MFSTNHKALDLIPPFLLNADSNLVCGYEGVDSTGCPVTPVDQLVPVTAYGGGVVATSVENKMNFTNSSFIMLLTLYKEKLVNDITVIHYQYKI